MSLESIDEAVARSAAVMPGIVAAGRKHRAHTGALTLTLLAPLLPLLFPPLAANVFDVPGARDAALLLALALVCTLLPFTLSLVALRKLSAFAALLAVNLEPVYAIVLAIVLLGEQHELGAGFYAGVCVILSTVFIHPWLMRRRHVAGAGTLAVAEAKNLVD